MKIRNSWYFGLVFFVAVQVQAQNPVIDAIMQELLVWNFGLLLC